MTKRISAMIPRIFKRAVRLFVPPSKNGLPAVSGEAGPDWYDAAYRMIPQYAIPYWHSHYYPIWTVIADRVRRAGARRVLDVGCGSGQLASCLFELAGVTAYVGLDFSAEAIAMARRACPAATFVVGDALAADVVADSAYDMVICTEMLEHVDRDLDVIGRFAEGMRCLFTVPNFPFDSHVRHFSGPEEVSGRYARFFDDLDILGIRGLAQDTQVYYLCEGVRTASKRV